MTIQRDARYPVPDRSNFTPNEFVSDPNLREGDLGARADVLSDGRPLRVESWWQEGFSFITAFFSVLDLEQATPEQLLELLMPVLISQSVPPEHRRLSAGSVKQINDASGNRVFTLTFVVGEPD